MTQSTVASEENSLTSQQPGPKDKASSYYVDTSELAPSEDKFCRYPFASRVAETIARRSDPENLIVGINGQWGEGKSVVLGFIKFEFEIYYPDVILIDFNPWRYGSEEEILLNFFGVIAQTLGKSLKSNTEKYADLISVASEIASPLMPAISLTPVGLPLAGVVGGIGKLAQKFISRSTLEDFKRKVDEWLENEKKHIVIFIDDIDRLDKSEIQALFRLIKLTADFQNTTYILYFDEDMVAAALSDKYGSGVLGDHQAGRDFLEKIIQVPLKLPKAGTFLLREYLDELIDVVLKDSQVNNSESIKQNFGFIIRWFEPRLQTPRICKRYANALAFSLQILRGEVNIVDLMAIEGIKVFYPDIYNFIRDHGHFFVYENYRIANAEESENQFNEFMQQIINRYNRTEQVAIIDLIVFRFPFFQRSIHKEKLFDRLPVADASGWYSDKRVCVSAYFDKYFLYSFSDRVFSDVAFESFVSNLEDETLHDVQYRLSELITCKNVDDFITKLSGIVNNITSDKFSPSVSKNLAIALAKCGNDFSITGNIFRKYRTVNGAAYLVKGLILWVSEDEEERFEFTKKLFAEDCFVGFLIELLRCMRGEEQNHQPTLFLQSIDSLRIILADKIKDYCKKHSILEPTGLTMRFIAIWAEHGSKEELQNYLARLFAEDQINLMELMNIYFEEDGIVNKENYQRLTQHVDADFLRNHILEAFGKDFANQEVPERTLPLEQRSAKIFCNYYAQFQREKADLK